MRPQLESITLPVDGSVVAAIRQRDPAAQDAPRMLCIHGWLDNANSFVPMMPYLPAFDLVTIDLPGHGYSDALVQGYSLHEMSYQLSAIIEALGWTDCHLVGHSLGGTLASMLAVANPQLVQSLTLVDCSGPLSEEADQLPGRMQRALQDRRRPQRFESRHFPDKNSAVQARLKAAKMQINSARLIIDRQLAQTDQGYRWRFDPRWRHTSSQYQTLEQVQAILGAITCKTLTILADDGFLASRSDTDVRLNCLQNHQSCTLPGHHHLHMDTPEPVAAAINRFLETQPDLGN